MTGIQSRSRKLSLSLAVLLVLLLLIGPAFVPQELRADAASRIADLVQYFDAALLDKWHSVLASRGSEHRASVSVTHTGSDSHAGALSVLTEGESPSAAADENSSDTGSISTDSASNSMASLLSDILKDGNPGSRGNFGAVAGGSGGGNAPAGSGGNANRSGGAGASTGGGGAHSSSGKGAQAAAAASDSRNSEGNAHQDRVTGNGFDSVYGVAGASWKQAASSEPFNGLSSDEPGANNWSGGGHDEDSVNALDPANGDPVGQLLNGPDHPPQGGSGSQNEISNGANSDGSDGHLLDSTDSGPLSSIPEPGSLVLLSLGLGAIMLRDKFRSAR